MFRLLDTLDLLPGFTLKKGNISANTSSWTEIVPDNKFRVLLAVMGEANIIYVWHNPDSSSKGGYRIGDAGGFSTLAGGRVFTAETHPFLINQAWYAKCDSVNSGVRYVEVRYEAAKVNRSLQH